MIAPKPCPCYPHNNVNGVTLLNYKDVINNTLSFINVSILFWVSIPEQNIMTKMQVGEERVYSAYTSMLLFITKGSQDWNSNRSGSRSWCRGHGGILLTGLLPLASYRTQDYQPRDDSIHNGPSHPWSLIENMPYSWKHFLKRGSFLCDYSSCVKLTYKTSQSPS